MHRPGRKLAAQDLAAYVDRRLPAAARLHAAAALARDPLLAAVAAAYEAQTAGLHVLYDHVLEEPVPAPLLALTRWPRSRPRRWAASGASLLLLLAGGVAAWWFGRKRRAADRAVQEAAEAALRLHLDLEAQNIAEPQFASEEELFAALARAFGPGAPWPVLREAGLVPVSVRSEHASGAPSTLILCRGPGGGAVSLYVRPRASRKAVAVERSGQGAYSLFSWTEGPLVYVLVGDVDPAWLSGVACRIRARHFSTALGATR